MKVLKLIVVLMIFVGSAAAQPAAATEWKELKSVKEVVERIHQFTSKENTESVKNYSETLMNATTAMVNSKIPVAYKNARRQTAIRKIGQVSKKLNELVAANAPDEELIATFDEIRTLYLAISDLSK